MLAGLAIAGALFTAVGLLLAAFRFPGQRLRPPTGALGSGPSASGPKGPTSAPARYLSGMSVNSCS